MGITQECNSLANTRIFHIISMRYILPFVFITSLILLVSFSGKSDNSNDGAWLKAAQHMVMVTKDPLVSTPNLERVKTFIGWAVDNGYKVEVSRHDDVAGVNTNMYFMVIKKL